MAGEGNQVKWVGIRPTNPAENIPVTESTPLTSIKVEPKEVGTIFKTTEQSPLTQIKVEPLAAGTEFKTLTKKRSPAVSDVSAISGIISQHATGVVAGGRFDITFGAVPAGEIWVITAISSYCSALWGSSQINLMRDAELHVIASPNVIGLTAYWNGRVLIEEDEYFVIENRTATNGNTYHVSVRGYQIDLY